MPGWAAADWDALQGHRDILTDVRPERGKRYYCTTKPDSGTRGNKTFLLVEGIPDPAKPDDPKKDRPEGRVMVEAPQALFWQRLRDEGYRWVERSWARFWEYRGAANLGPTEF